VSSHLKGGRDIPYKREPAPPVNKSFCNEYFDKVGDLAVVLYNWKGKEGRVARGIPKGLRFQCIEGQRVKKENTLLFNKTVY